MNDVKRYSFKGAAGLYVYEGDYDALRADVEQARRTADHWKAEHLAGNAVIDQLRAEVERLREIREIASQCAANGGYLSSQDLIELRALLARNREQEQ